MEFKEKIIQLTTMNNNNLKSLFEVIKLIHSDDIYTQILERKDYYEIDTIEGKIYIKEEDNELKFKFIPSQDFQNKVKETIESKNSLLTRKLEKNLNKVLIKTYKDIL